MRPDSFGDYLLKERIISPDVLKRAVNQQGGGGAQLDTILLGMGCIREEELLEALGRFKHSRTVSASDLAAADPDVVNMISPRMAKRFRVLPFRRDGKRLSVACINPGDLLVEDELALLTGCMISTFVALEPRLAEAFSAFLDLGMSLQMQNVLNQLKGTTAKKSEMQPTVPAPKAPPTTPAPLSPSEAATQPIAPTVDPDMPTQKMEISELEMDEDDLALFPSLRSMTLPTEQETTEAAVDPPLKAPPEVIEPQTTLEPQTMPVAPMDRTPEQRLAVAAAELQNAEMRDDIADTILEFAAPFLSRRLLVVVRQGTIVGWRGEGDGVDKARIREIAIPVHEPSVFLGLTEPSSFWLGALPPMPRNLELAAGLGGDHPRDCVVLPIAVRSKIVCFLYGDNGDAGVAGLQMGLLRRLIGKAGLAFQVYLLKSKIRLF